jgi:hypothetical protein
MMPKWWQRTKIFKCLLISGNAAAHTALCGGIKQHVCKTCNALVAAQAIKRVFFLWYGASADKQQTRVQAVCTVEAA